MPASSAPVEDGAVLAKDGVILAVGPYRELTSQCGRHAKIIDYGEAALMPALVNAHAHLELSTLQSEIALPQESFATWLKALLPLRPSLTPERLREGVRIGEELLTASGACLCGDITNGVGIDRTGESPALSRNVFFEVLGFDRRDLETAMEPSLLHSFRAREKEDPFLSLAAHACYSASAALIREAKAQCRKTGRVFSIHAAEHEEEVRFLMSGDGLCREVLEGLGKWTSGWTPPRKSPVGYLDSLGVLDERTLLVHAVHLDRSDWEIVAQRNCGVCFCLRSNRNLNVGRADIAMAMKLGVTAALGTDSLASNKDLSLFAEAAFALNAYPDLKPESAFRMITDGGAAALQRLSQYGSIEPGRRAALLAVALPGPVSKRELFETVIYQGEKGAHQWASCPNHS